MSSPPQKQKGRRLLPGENYHPIILTKDWIVKCCSKVNWEMLVRFEAVILKDIPPPQCLQNSKDFLMKRKMQVSRSPSTLNNANQALRLVSSCGGLHS
ncbi:hypothetical protein QJS04_geneDACA002204 [Acorus gramineus]|uniref:BRCT domain-containing protein n=1 Tax=Acorus gramineus TaxID=55184 RepID=A0AAV9ABD8_ACOGR|nr:hypothetical protein QJS04_geneDACA002204 [Acorus gramineus]